MPRANVTASGQPRVSRQVELLLVEDVESLGKQGEIVRVKPGFARNFLLPQGLATIATEQNKRLVERHREKQESVRQAKIDSYRKLAKQLADYSLTLEANANEENHLYGSILGAEIAKGLRSAGFDLKADQIRLEGPIKELGKYIVRVHIHADIETDVKVWVVPAAKVKA